MGNIRLGIEVIDSASGLIGVAVAKIEYLHGSTQILVQPPVDKDGKFVEATWIYEDRLNPTVAEPNN